MYKFLLTRLPSRRLRVRYSMAVLLLIVILVVTIYKAIVPAPPDSQKEADFLEWEPSPTQISRSLPTETTSISFIIKEKLFEFSEKINWIFLKKEKEPDYSNLVITGPYATTQDDDDFCSMITEEDAAAVLKKYGRNPFLLTFGKEIGVGKMMQILVRKGYCPQKGVYDCPSTGVMLEGFSFPLKDEVTGYAVCVQKGKIVQIRKLRDYEQYLRAKEMEMDYTATGIFTLYLPEFRGKIPTQTDGKNIATSPRAFPPARPKWSPDQITFAYVSKNWTGALDSPKFLNAIRDKVFQEVYKGQEPYITFQFNYLSVSRTDVKKIIETYGDTPFRLRVNDKIDEASVFRKLERAGYKPRLMGKKQGFSFPLKNESGGYAVFVSNGHISQIRELKNYTQFLEWEKKKVSDKYEQYTARGVVIFYLPDFEKDARKPTDGNPVKSKPIEQ